jgi:hypothetical protein
MGLGRKKCLKLGTEILGEVIGSSFFVPRNNTEVPFKELLLCFCIMGENKWIGILSRWVPKAKEDLEITADHVYRG